MTKSILMLVFALMYFVTGYGNVNMETLPVQPGTAQSVLSEDAAENSLDGYMASVEARSDQIATYLEHDAMTQMDMNAKSQELYEIWDAAMNYVLAEAERILPENEFAELAEAQRAWLLEKEQAVEEAGREVEGGSVYPLVVNMEAAQLTQERVYELYEMLGQSGIQ